MTGADVTIRSATADNEDAVVALWRACGLTVAYNDSAADFRFACAKSNSDVLVGMDGERVIVGSVMVGHDGHRGWVYYAAADPDRRDEGIGRAMMQAAETWLEQRNVVKVQLMVRETNTPAIAFYERLGFETIPRTVMQKWLKPCG